jgi:hypothetical protein
MGLSIGGFDDFAVGERAFTTLHWLWPCILLYIKGDLQLGVHM